MGATRKQLAKWIVKVSNDDIVIDIMDQMYESNWFLEETMTTWEESQDNQKTWAKCQAFFEIAYIAEKGTMRHKDRHMKA